jgi:hypothetical protein
VHSVTKTNASSRPVLEEFLTKNNDQN